MLLLLLELGIDDPDIIAAAAVHDVLEDVKIDRRELENIIARATSSEALRITKMVTNPEKTGDAEKDKHIKEEHYKFIALDPKASVLKIADRLHNLRSLEIVHVAESELTERHVQKAQEQARESREYILPIAEKYGYGERLLADIEKVEKRVSEVSLILVQRKTREAVVV